MANQPTAAQVAAQNNLARQILIGQGLHMIKQLQPVTSSALGGSIRVPLERMGVMTGIFLDVTIPVNITAAATPSEFAPYNFFPQVTYTDYAGLQRVITNGYQLHALNCWRSRSFPNNSQKMAGFITGETGINTNILYLPTAAAQNSIQFSLYIPIAYDPTSDLRGAVLSQTIYGDHYVTLQLPNQFVGSDALANVYTAGTVALGSQNSGQISVTAYQQYIMPQVMDATGQPIVPMIDLSTIYAIEGGYNDSSNITTGQPKYINWVNNRAVMSALHIFDNGGTPVLNETDVNKITLLGNSNTNIREMSPRYLRNQMRSILGADLPSGVYMIGSRAQPITTQLYGNVQTKFDIATANSGAYFLSQYESTYLAGTPLPGVIQG
jgi:hypothetical protein